ncbi:MAG: lamin tail domain-containing protein, partial [Phycisphaerae bacterium]|nr:lamin tail domain-containing protein [Phycisphaerae bacterium]
DDDDNDDNDTTEPDASTNDAAEKDNGGEDAGGEDISEEDAGEQDTGEEDATEEDTSEEDIEETDLGEEDAGEEDTAEQDAGEDDLGELDAGGEAPEIAINEIMANPKNHPASKAQFVELYNPSATLANLEGYKLVTGNRTHTISAANGKTTISSKDYLVIGLSDDSAENGYAHIEYVIPAAEWGLDASNPKVALTDNAGTQIDAALFDSNFPQEPGASTERISVQDAAGEPENWQVAPSLITFLEGEGYFKADRGSPGDPNFAIVDKGAFSSPSEGSIEDEFSVYRFTFDLPAKELALLNFDPDGVNSDLDGFMTLLDEDGEPIGDGIIFEDDMKDFYILYQSPASATYISQLQADFFSAFEAGEYELSLVPADALLVIKEGGGISVKIKVGETVNLDVTAHFPREFEDYPTYPLARNGVDWHSDASGVASVANGIVTGEGIGNAVITASLPQSGGTITGTISAEVWDDALNDTCAGAVNATAGGTFTGSTIGAADDYNDPDCISLAYSGPDLVYKLSPSSDSVYDIEVTPNGDFDPALYLLTNCSSSACYDDDEGTVLNGPGEPESLTDVDIPGGTTVFIIVDGEMLDEGSFSLTVTKQ